MNLLSSSPGRIGLAGLSGILTGLAFPGPSLVFLLPFCLIPLFLAVDKAWPGAGPRNVFSLFSRAYLPGYVFGTVFWLVTMPWIFHTVRYFGGVGPVLATLALLATALFLAIPLGLMTLAAGVSRKETSLWRIGVWLSAWGAQEGLRTHLFGGFPWGVIGAPLADYPAFIQLASLGSVSLVSLAVVLVNLLLNEALHAKSTRGRGLGVFLAAAVVVLTFGYGQWRIARIDAATPGTDLPVMTVAVLQPGVSQEMRWTPGSDELIYHDLWRQTLDLAEKTKPDVILWPESACPLNWSFSYGLQEDLLRFCKNTGISILLNTVWSDDPGSERAPYYNAALLVTPDGPEPPYFKQRLVPFGEYVPLGALLRMIRPISRAVPSSFSAGTSGRLLRLKDWDFGGAVCYEVVYPWLMREHTRSGADVLFTLTNDAWYGKFGAQRQHWQLALFRAVETGRPLFRAAATGISGWVDAAGRARTVLPIDQPASFSVALGKEPGSFPISQPLAVRTGEGLPIVCALACLAGILRPCLRWRQKTAAALEETSTK